MSLVHGKQQLLDRIKTKKNFNIAKSIPSSLLLSLIIMLFLCNWFWGKTNGYDFYRIKLLIAILGVATIVLLALSERWNTAAGNDRDSRIPDEGDRFFSLSPDMLCVVGFDGCFKRINPAAEKILGYSPAEMVGKLFIEFVHPDDREATLKEAESIAAGNNTVGLENRWRCRNESYKWIAWTVSPCCEEELIYGIGREITDRKEIEAALLESNILFENVIESTGDSIFVKDTQSRYLLLNSTAASIIGLPKSEIIGKKDAELFPLEIADMLVENDRRIWQSGIEETLEEVVKDSEGNILTFLSTKSPLRDRAGNITGVVGVARDISDRKQAEIALQQSEEKYRCLIEATSQIIWDTNANGEVVTEQPGWSAFTGRTYEEMKGWKWLNDIHPDDREETARIWSQAVTNRTIYKIEHRLRRYDGEYRYMSVRAVPILNADSSIREWVGVHADITPRKRAEAELRQQKEFLSSIYDSVDYSIFVLDIGADGEFRYSGWNRGAELLSGISSEFGRGKTPEEILSESTAAFFRNKLRECVLENSSIFYERAISFGTTETWSITTLTPLRDESGKICRIVGSATNITDRKKAEQALAEQLKLSVFTADVGIALTQNHTLPATLQNCTHAVVRHLDAAFARIWTLNEQENVLELQASAGMYTHIDGAHSRVVVGEFKIGLIAKDRQPYLTNDVLEDARVSDREWAAREGMVAFAGYPLIVDDQLVGVIAMFARYELNESTLIALASIADAIALGIKRKQTEEALARQQQTLRGIIDNAPIWVWMANASGRMLLVNKTFCQDVAISEENFLAASHYSEVLGLEASANCMGSDVQAWSQDTPFYAEEVLQLADGEYHHLETIKTQVKDASGNAIGLIGLGLDVTQERESKRKLQDSEAKFRKLAEQEALLNQLASNIRASLDLDTILATTVRQIRELLQLDRCLFIWYQPEAAPPVWNITYEAKNPDLPSMLGLYPTDITGSHAAHIANLEIIRIDDFETVADRVERNFFISTGFKSLLNIPLQTQSGKIGVIACVTCGVVRHWSDEEVELLMAVGNQLTIAINQSELYTQSVDSARIAQEQTKQLELALCELKLAQTQLIQAEKMSSLGQMVAGIAHEINNPVSFIFGNLTYTQEYTGNLMKLLQMYRDEYPEPPQAIQENIDALELDFLLDDLPKMLSSMQVGATRIRDIVRSLRNFSRLDESEMKKVNIHEGIDSTLMILEHRLKAQSVSRAGTEHHCPIIQVVKEYGELPLVECYAGLLNQVFMNIIANAIDVLQEPLQNPGIICIRTEVEGSFAAIAISDNGAGITDKVKQRIFDPFYTTKAIGSGTGMGLAISHSIIVEKHKGEINCISAVGKGTEFVIKIPIVSH
jgi:PAS domain S-box-containing protein